MPLVRRNGKLLRRNGKLASSIDCCDCDPPPDVCPPCCVRVALGEFDSDGNLSASVAAGTAVVLVKVVLPTPHNRIVCDGQEITVQWEITDHEGTGSNDAWMRFGPAWLVTGHSPAVNSGNGKVYDWGLVDWGNVEDDTYSVTLQFRKCFLDVTDFLGYIWIGMSNPAVEFETEIERCETLEWCCRDEYECQNCCALLDMGGVIQHDGKFYKVSQSNDANGIFTGIVEVITDEPGIICKGQGLTINAYLVPPRHGIAPPNNMIVEHPLPWEQTAMTPGINPVDGESTPEKTDWGALDATEYSISLEIDCDPEECGGGTGFPTISVVNGDYGLGESVSFTKCDDVGCCCPVDCRCGCEWKLPDDFCDNQDCSPYISFLTGCHTGDGVKVEGFTFTAEAAVNAFKGNSRKSLTITQQEPSRHFGGAQWVNGKCCAKTTAVGVRATQEYEGEMGGSTVEIGFYPGSGNCNPNIHMAMFGQDGEVYGTFPVSLSGCSTITGSGTSFTTWGIAYNWTITATLVGAKPCDCPPL